MSFCFAPYKKAAVPAKKIKTGAQKCVIQRVKNSTPDVCSKSVGSDSQAPNENNLVYDLRPW